MHNSLATASVGLMILLGLGAARSEPEWTIASPPPGTVALPALASRSIRTDGEQVRVCMQAGARPQSYALISRACWDGAETCTVFVGVPAHDFIRLQEYDAGAPPVVVAVDEICTQPAHAMSTLRLPGS